MLQFTDYFWYVDGTPVDVVYYGVKDDCFTINIGLNQNCTDLEMFQFSIYENGGNVKSGRYRVS